MSSIIPWGEEKQVSKEKIEIEELVKLFKETPVAQLAAQTLIGELFSSKLQWKNLRTDKFVAEKKIPVGWQNFIENAVNAVVITGVFFWKKKRNGAVVVAHPQETWFTEKRNKWNAEILFAPLNANLASELNEDIVQSPMQKAKPFAIQLEKHRRLHLLRDVHNSKPEVFVSISDKIQNSGHSKPWFRSVGADFVDTFGESLEHPKEYETLIKDRADVIRELGKETITSRERRKFDDEMDDLEQNEQTNALHREHVISDGYVASQAHMLNSLNDGLQFTTQLENAILGIMGVPPSAIGRNINSERLASSNQLVARSLKPFNAFVDQLKQILESALKKASFDEKDNCVLVFSKVLSQFDIEKLEPILTTEATIEFYSHAYNIPQTFFDKEAIAHKKKLLLSDKGSSQTQSKQDGVDQKQLEPAKKRQKKIADQRIQIQQEKAQQPLIV